MSDRIKKLGRELADQHMKGYAVGRREALADAKARIEDLHYGDDNLLIGTGYQLAVNDALAALTQPQTEQCPECGNETGPDMCGDIWHEEGGAATAAGVADADLEGIEVHINGSSDLSPEEAEILGDAMKRAYVLMKERQGTTAIKPTPYAKAFRERVCPVPEFPSVGTAPQEAQADPKKDVCPNCGEVANGCNYCRKTPAPVPQTEGENVCPECDGHCTDYSGSFACDTCSGKGKEKA